MAGVLAAAAAGAGARADALEARAPAGSGFERSVDAVLEGDAGPARLHLEAALAPRSPMRFQGAAGAMPEIADPARTPRWIWIGAGAAGAIVGSAYNAFSEETEFPFHVTNEGWFGRDSYAGGADKTSHFASYYAVTRIMNEFNLAFGASRDQAALLASGVSLLAGLVGEIGDGTNRYGFSWGDLGMDALGAAAGLAVLHFRVDDLIGFHYGLVPAPEAEAFGLGKNYSAEIYTGDLKIAGLSRRAGFHPGPARFLLLSATYGVKGYPYSPPEIRQRQVGIELGVNFEEVLKAVGVPRHKWWGVVLYTLFDIVRIPYTAWGFRYDLNGKKWYGPDTGDSFPGADASRRRRR